MFENVYNGLFTSLAPGHGINTDTFLLMGIFMCVSIEDNSAGGGVYSTFGDGSEKGKELSNIYKVTVCLVKLIE